MKYKIAVVDLLTFVDKSLELSLVVTHDGLAC